MFLTHISTKGYLCSVLKGNYYKWEKKETAIFFLSEGIDVQIKCSIEEILRIGKYDNILKGKNPALYKGKARSFRP